MSSTLGIILEHDDAAGPPSNLYILQEDCQGPSYRLSRLLQ